MRASTGTTRVFQRSRHPTVGRNAHGGKPSVQRNERTVIGHGSAVPPTRSQPWPSPPPPTSTPAATTAHTLDQAQTACEIRNFNAAGGNPSLLQRAVPPDAAASGARVACGRRLCCAGSSYVLGRAAAPNESGKGHTPVPVEQAGWKPGNFTAGSSPSSRACSCSRGGQHILSPPGAMSATR
jgi:hypothetical protein